jgi:methionyl-tRNA formyltransferase
MRVALIGEGALAIHGVQTLLEHGLRPLFLCSPDRSLAATAQDISVPHCQTREALRSCLAEMSPDVLLSISNPWVLQPDELSRVGRVAINYHDSLLPRYAGMHATSWALMNGESRHGITWHEVTAGIDAGRVLHQEPVQVLPGDTAFSLNIRCFDAAARSFKLVLDHLCAGTLDMRPQVGERSYFAARRRAPAQCAMDPWSDADEVLKLIRAHDFGAGCWFTQAGCESRVG